MGGFIPYPRDLIDSLMRQQPKPYSKEAAKADLFLLAEYQTKGRYKRGTIYRSKAELAERWKRKEDTVKRWLDEWMKEGFCKVKSQPLKGTEIRLLTYFQPQKDRDNDGDSKSLENTAFSATYRDSRGDNRDSNGDNDGDNRDRVNPKKNVFRRDNDGCKNGEYLNKESGRFNAPDSKEEEIPSDDYVYLNTDM